MHTFVSAADVGISRKQHMQGYEHLKGSEEVRRALSELIRVGLRAVAAYRAVERRAVDHRVQAALVQLRRDHRRHIGELRAILNAVGGAVVARDGGDVDFGAWGLETMAMSSIMEGVKRVEAELRDVYSWHVARGYPEPLHAALSRHLREEEAHLRWLHESRWWRVEV